MIGVNLFVKQCMFCLYFLQMDSSLELADIDLSFLDEDQKYCEFINSLSSFNAVLFSNSEVDMRVIEIIDSSDLVSVIKDNFKCLSTLTQVILPNGNKDENCPFFRIIMQDYCVTNSTNYKLETFMRQAGILGIHPKCTVALVLGLVSNSMDSEFLDVPMSYRLCSLTDMRSIDMLSEIDLTCLSSVIHKKRVNDYLMDIPGMPLPYVLPKDIHFKIFQYLRHQEADQVLKFWEPIFNIWDPDDVGEFYYWDLHFWNVFHSPPAWWIGI